MADDDDTPTLRISTVPAPERSYEGLVTEVVLAGGRVHRTIHPQGTDEAIVLEFDPHQVSVVTAHGANVDDSTRGMLERHGWRSAFRSEQVELWVTDTRAVHARLDQLSQNPALDTSRRLPASVLFQSPASPHAPGLGLD